MIKQSLTFAGSCFICVHGVFLTLWKCTSFLFMKLLVFPCSRMPRGILMLGKHMIFGGKIYFWLLKFHNKACKSMVYILHDIHCKLGYNLVVCVLVFRSLIKKKKPFASRVVFLMNFYGKLIKITLINGMFKYSVVFLLNQI